MRLIRNSTANMSLLRKIGVYFSVVALIVALVPITASAQQPTCDIEYYSRNNITFYNPCSSDTCSAVNSGGALTSAGPSSLIGASNEEKTWNYFTARGLTSIAAAGAMGNIAHESNFSASVEEASGGGGLGLIQWTGSRRTNLEAAAAAAGVNLADNDQALLFQLNYLWDGEYKSLTWQEQVNAEEVVEGDTYKASFNSKYSANKIDPQTGNGSTMVFHALVERSNDVPTEAEQYSGVGVLQGRIDKAKGFLSKYDGTSARGGCSISAGGLTWEQAVTVAKKLVDEWDAIYCGTPLTGGNNGGYCDWTEGYCTAGAAWMSYTTAPDPGRVPGIPNGVDVANTLVTFNPDVYTNANPDGSNLQPFSVWSFGLGSSGGQPGHTGTIVGLGEGGSIITLETNWGGNTAGATNTFLYNPGHKVAVFEYPSFEAFKTSRDSYTYNNVATPIDSSVAAEMGKKMMAFMGGQ